MNSDTPLQLLGGLTVRDFLRDYWQKKPLLIRQAIPGFETLLSPDELAGLSLEEEVESRLVIEHGSQPWELRHGPFSEDSFRTLPERDWTLLVQAVDQFVPEVAELRDRLTFLPKWRIDDLMISYAAPGGGVGPHYDNYDVFLLQGHGTRCWRLGQMCDSESPLLPHDSLKILQHFEQTEEWSLQPGDMLYLPPCLAHWGIAEDECMTYSIGFRAPSAAEILLHFTDFLAQSLPDEERYSDADMLPADQPSQIQQDVLKRLKTLLDRHLNDEQLLLTWFGQLMTEPRYPELIGGATIDAQELLSELENGAIIVRNPSARLAWSALTGQTTLFASGQSRSLSADQSELVKLICDAEALHIGNLQAWLDNEESRTLLLELLKQGSLEFTDD